MMQIKYQVLGYTNTWNPETKKMETHECLAGVMRPYSEANEELAKREAYNGEYTIVNDGQPEPEATTDDVLNALLGVTV